MEEQAALYSERGTVIGRAPRSRVRAENLRHGATGIVVFNPQGRIYVHQRTLSKDLYPGLFDFTAGGVIQAGEDPFESARREAAEELGVRGELVSLGEADFADEHARYRAFRYWMIANGPLKLQAEEVLGGEWLEVSELIAQVAAEPGRFMPDAVALFLPWLASLDAPPPASGR